MNKPVDELKEALIKYGQLSEMKNFTPGVSGNMSVRFGDNILITTSGSANGYLSKDDFVVIDFEGNVVEGSKKPSSEKLLHCEFYKRRKDIKSILHMHSPYLTSFAAAGLALDEPVMPENIFYFGQIPLAKYALPSTRELVDNVAIYFDEYDAVLMENHGFIVGGSDLQDAFLKLCLAESYAQVIVNTKILGGAKLLSEAQAKEILELRKKL